jgi:hypothetical protein
MPRRLSLPDMIPGHLHGVPRGAYSLTPVGESRGTTTRPSEGCQEVAFPVPRRGSDANRRATGDPESWGERRPSVPELAQAAWKSRTR